MAHTGERTRRALSIAITALVGIVASACLSAPAPCACQPPEPDWSSLPPPKPEPPLPAGGYPVVVHDCATTVLEETNQHPDRFADVHAISINRTHESAPSAAEVYVHATQHPLVLVLTDRTSMSWRLHADPGVQIAFVVMNTDMWHELDVGGLTQVDDPRITDPDDWPDLSDPALAALAATPPGTRTSCDTASLFSIRTDH